MKLVNLAVILSIVAVSFSFHSEVNAQQRKIPKAPFQITDASTGKPIPEVLVIPRYYSGTGIFLAPEGPGKGTYRYYLDKPFIYRTGDHFILKTPKFSGLPLFPVLIGKGRSIEGILVIAPKYRPIWFENLWQTRDIFNTTDIRKLQLTPISDKEWSLLLEKKLNPLIEETVLPLDDFRFWGLYEAERALYVYYNKDERELIKSFLQQAKIEPK